MQKDSRLVRTTLNENKRPDKSLIAKLTACILHNKGIGELFFNVQKKIC